MKSGPIRFNAISMKGATKAALNCLIPMGKFFRDDFPGGSINIDRKYLETMVANWQADGSPDLRIDYFHDGASEKDGLPIDRKVAAGWISKLEVRDDGLWANTDWTAKAKAHIEADEFRYFSPEFHPDPKSRHTGKRQGPTLMAGGLLNDPYFKELPRLAANEAPTTKDENLMDKKLLCAALGIPETSTDAEITAAINANAAEKSKAAEALKAAESAKDGALKAAETANAKLAERIASLETEKADREVEALISKLKSEKRIVASQGDDVKAYVKATSLKAATDFFSKQPTVVPTGVIGTDTQTENPAVETLQAEYDKKLDEATKAGASVLVASAQLKRDAKFAPLFPNTIKAAEAN